VASGLFVPKPLQHHPNVLFHGLGVRVPPRRFGRKRAAFWRNLGFPNLVRARAAKAKKREQRLRLARIQAAKRFSPFAIIDELSSYDGLSLEHPSKARWSKKPHQR
jgi:hypothetical protein